MYTNVSVHVPGIITRIIHASAFFCLIIIINIIITVLTIY